jgi:peptide/nickel transport system permease protein
MRVEHHPAKPAAGSRQSALGGCVSRPAAEARLAPAGRWRLPRLRVSPLNRRRWSNFRANRRGFWSLIVFAVLFVLTLCAELVANDRPIVLLYKGEVLFPVLVDYPEAKFGGFLATTDYKDPMILEEIGKNGWALWPPIGHSASSTNKDYPLIKNADGQCLGFPAPAPWMTSAQLCEASEGQLARYHAVGNRNWLGTDDQGRDVLSTIMYGARISLGVGLAAVLFALVLGVSLGLLSGYFGGRLDAFIMRVADIQLSFPAILIALLIDGVARVALPAHTHDEIAIPVLILAIGVSGWVQYARTVRGSTLIEKNKEYVQAARVIGRHPFAIMLRHVLPNVMGPVLVIGTIHIATAIITEATLSFLGVGVPPTRPSLGTLIRIGNEFLLSGEWWITVFPGVALVILVLSVNLLGDWLRDALNPKLR